MEEAKGREDKIPVNDFLQKVFESMNKKLKRFNKKNNKNGSEMSAILETPKEVASSEND